MIYLFVNKFKDLHIDFKKQQKFKRILNTLNLHTCSVEEKFKFWNTGVLEMFKIKYSLQ